jgi:hypothetical protein
MSLGRFVRRVGWWLFAIFTLGLGPIMWECLDPERFW